jgi:hypothetical protein
LIVKRRDTFILVGVILVAATGAFSVGRSAALRQRTDATGAQPEWLQGVSPESAQTEQRFEQRARQLMSEVRAKQTVLTSMLPDTRFTGEQILGQVDDIAQSYATLARSVGGHIATLRSILPAAQRQQIMQSCANSVRGSMQRRYRWRGGAEDQGQGSMGDGRGGWGQGEGRGAGYGRQYRGGRSDGTQGLVGRLRLTQDQSTWIQQRDPDFEAQCIVLRDRLYEVHTSLVASLEDTQVTEQELATKVETLVEAHTALEKRVAQHIVLLRPRLTQEQRDQLGGLCSRKDVTASIAGPVSPNLLDGIVPGLLSSQVLAGSL